MAVWADRCNNPLYSSGDFRWRHFLCHHNYPDSLFFMFGCVVAEKKSKNLSVNESVSVAVVDTWIFIMPL